MAKGERISRAQAALNVEAAARLASGRKDISKTVKEIRSVAISNKTQEAISRAQASSK